MIGIVKSMKWTKNNGDFGRVREYDQLTLAANVKNQYFLKIAKHGEGMSAEGA